MKAIQLIAYGSPGKFELRDVPDPHPTPDEVVVQVEYCGLNHLDLWLEEAGLPVKIPLPRTPGGEVSGRILELGSNVKDWKAGDAVAVQSSLFCGECEFCKQGEESICIKGELLGMNRDGGFAERVAVPARTLVRLPAGVDFETSAALTLAGSTAMHMLTHRASVRPGDGSVPGCRDSLAHPMGEGAAQPRVRDFSRPSGTDSKGNSGHPADWVLVIGGASGVGSAAIQIAKYLGAHVISTGSNETKRTLAKNLGADFVVDSNNPDWPAEVRKLTNKRGVDLVVEHVGGDVLLKCFECLARNGTIVTCGATAGREVKLNLWPLFVKQQRLIGSYSRNRADIIKTLDWAAAGKIKPVIDSIFPLAQTPAAFAKLRSREVLGKVLVSIKA